ncbi:MAG: M56 family metallopeptidase [Oscillospiraceae bacterium]|nr:M56 family metallopeptidase [Oscillospiraceae bacterium]
MVENLFINIIEISMTSAAAIGIVLLFSNLFENKFRKKWRYWLWVFVAIYLIIPFKINLPDAPIKMELPKHEMILTKKEEETVHHGNVSPGFSEEISGEKDFEHEEISPVPEKEPQSGNPGTDINENEHPGTEPVKLVYTVVYVAAVAWAIGAGLVFGWNVAMYLRFVNRSKPWNRKVGNPEVLELFDCIKEEMGIPEKVRLYENRLIKSPMMVGFRNPRVLLPSEALLPEEYEFVLRHELTHYKRGDIWYKFLLMLAASVHWFNPMVGTMCRHAENDIEITCDEAVVRAMEGDRRQEYCATILNIMRRGQNSPLLLSTSFYGGAKTLKRRFAEILQPKEHRGTILFVMAALVVVICGTLVACGTEETFPEEEPSQEGAVSEATPEEIIIRADRIIQFAFTEMTYHETGYYTTILSDKVQDYIKALVEGKKKYFEEENIEIKETTYSVNSEVLYNADLGEKTEILYIVTEKYEWFVPGKTSGESKTDKYHAKLTYDTKTGKFIGFIIYGVTWMDDESYNVSMPEEDDPRPVVEGPDVEGKFPFIAEANWDRWVTYDGKPDTVMPTQPISSVLECEEVLENLGKAYPDITDWEIVYEDCYYELTNCYDPYSYSFRDIYMPERFAVLKTEQGKGFDRIFISTHEDYVVLGGENGYYPQRDFQCSCYEALESEVQVGDMSGAEHYQTEYTVTRGLWFPEEQKMLYFETNWNKVYPIYEVTKPLCLTSFGYLGKWTYGVDGNSIVPLTEERKDDLYFYVSENGGGHKEEIAVYYYFGDTKTLKKIEDSDANTEYSYPQVWFLDSETMLIDTDASLNFYDVSAGADPTVCVKKIGGTDGVKTYNFIREDKTVSGRYLWVYTSSETNEFRMCTFDKEGSVLSDFGLGLSAEGTIGSANYHDGLVYFSYHVYHNGRKLSSENYAVDARPDHDHILQADAW